MNKKIMLSIALGIASLFMGKLSFDFITDDTYVFEKVEINSKVLPSPEGAIEAHYWPADEEKPNTSLVKYGV